MSEEYRPTCVIRAPVTTRSGYGAMSRDIVRHIIEMDKYDVSVHSCRWGETPMNALSPDRERDKMILDRIVPEVFERQPDLYISITIPTEFIPRGRYNIGITAGIETSAATPQWVDAMNRMDVVFTISNHSRNVFLQSKYQEHAPDGGVIRVVECKKPIEVLHNCVDTYMFKKTPPHELEKSVREHLDDIPEDFAYLFVGHWLPGEVGQDRKNVGLMVKIFLELFKRSDLPSPALIMKTSQATNSLLDRETVLDKLQQIKQSVVLEEGQELPNVYLIHGDLTDSEMNSLYNHPKVKSHITITRGEGFGRPLLEASMTGKPIIASGWSGHLDFLNVNDCILLGGKLEPVHQSAFQGDWMMDGAQWFQVDQNMFATALMEVYNNYNHWRKRGNTLARRNKDQFSYKQIQKETTALFERYVPKFEPAPQKVELNLPTLDGPGKMPGVNAPVLNLPDLNVPDVEMDVELPEVSEPEMPMAPEVEDEAHKSV